MSPIILTRTDAERNMHRYYRLDVQPDLFGAWCLVRQWGRLGSTGRTRSVPYPTPAESEAALAQLRHAKERRGYVVRQRPR